MLGKFFKILLMREAIAHKEMRCETCGEVVQVIDIEQHVKEVHFHDTL
jgi:hypothetical protein